MNTTPQQQTTLNGIDHNAQAATIDAIRQHPTLGGVRFRASTRWTGGTRTTTTAGDFDAASTTHKRVRENQTFSDMPLPFHGSDQAPAPTEIALHALAACLTSTLVYHCTVRGITVRSVSAEIDASLDACGFLRLDDSTDSGFEAVNITLHADTDADTAELKDIIDHAPMLDVFTRAIPVKTSIQTAA